MIDCVLGIDPGGTTGFCLLESTLTVVMCGQVVDLTPSTVLIAIQKFSGVARDNVRIACEDFVVRGLRRRTHTAPKATMDLIGAVRTLPRVTMRTASQVKPWATDKRLLRLAGHEMLTGRPHAADAARHALYAGVRDLGWPDPLAKPDK